MRPIAHFSHAARLGAIVHVGATAGTDAERRLAGTSQGRIDFAAQAEQMFDNLDTVLALVDAGREHIVRVKAYVVDPRDMPAYRKIYERRLGPLAPCHVVVGAHGFPLPQAAVELDAVAFVGDAARSISDVSPAQSIAVSADGTCYIAIGPRGMRGNTTPQTQAAFVFAELARTLRNSGLTLRNVVNVHLTLSDIRHFDAVDAVYRATFADWSPSRCVVGAPLEEPSWHLQLEATAVPGVGKPIVSAQASPDGCSPAVLAGDTLYISGLTAGAEDCESQTRKVWEHINGLIAAAGFVGDESVLRTNTILTDWRDYAGFNAGYGANVQYPYPPRATVHGTLLNAQRLVQTEAIAHRAGQNAGIVQVPLEP